MKHTCLVIAVLLACACDEGGDGRQMDAGELTLSDSIPVYNDVWQPKARGETLIKIRGIQLDEEEMAMVGLGLGDSSRAEFRIFRADGELTAAVDVYSADGNHLDSGERGYGVGSHTNWKHYSDTDNYGMNIRIQHRNSGQNIYHVSPAINGLVAKKTAHADSASRNPTDSVFILAELPPPEKGLIVLQDSSNSDRCVSVRIKRSTSGWQQELPLLFETENGNVITKSDNSRLANDYLRCLRMRELLKK